MPKYEQLTEQEKQLIRARHREMVGQINATLPDEYKVSIDEHLEDKLNDEKEVAIYRIGQQIKQKEKLQQEIRKDLQNKHGRYQGEKNDAFARSLQYGFRTDGSKQSKEYNEQMYQDYLHNQDKLAYVRYRNILEFNPQELYDCGDDPLKLMEYYQKNEQLIQDAFVMSSLTNVNISNELKKALPVIIAPMEVMNKLGIKAAAAGGIDYLACPKLTPQQVTMLKLTNPDLFDIKTGSEEFRAICADIETSASESIHQFLDRFGENGENPNFFPGYFVHLKPQKTDPYTNARKEVPFAEYLKNKDDENYELEYRDVFEVHKINMVSKAYSNKYLERWQDAFVDNTPSIFEFERFNFNDFEKKLNGNIFQRIGRFFKGNSPQYNYLMKTYKNFNNPNHPDYLNDDKLRSAARLYREQKYSQGYREHNYRTIEGKRMAFASAIIETVDEMAGKLDVIDNEINNELMQNYPKENEPFLNPKDLEDNVIEDPIKDNEIDVQKDLNNDIEIEN